MKWREAKKIINKNPEVVKELELNNADYEIIREIIKARQESNITQKELADRCGVHFNTIHTIEHGRRNYNLLSLIKIISYFEYDLPTFMRELM